MAITIDEVHQENERLTSYQLIILLTKRIAAIIAHCFKAYFRIPYTQSDLPVVLDEDGIVVDVVLAIGDVTKRRLQATIVHFCHAATALIKTTNGREDHYVG